jgi:hypothetical protein
MNLSHIFQLFSRLHFNSRLRRSLKLVIAASVSLCLVVLATSYQAGDFNLPPASAQQPESQQIGQQVYQALPDFPKENQYVNKETGKVATNNTLVSRLIRYHLYVKGRLPTFRLDWKLTLADYLGANEYIEEGIYPGYDVLQTNPASGDRAAIKRLNRVRRDALINVLVKLFNPNYQDAPASTSPAPSSPPASPTPKPQSRPRLPQPGDAELLKP